MTPVTLSSMTLGTPINVGNQPTAIAITPDGTKAYVANYNGNGPGTVTPINLSTDATATITVGRGPDAIVITPDGDDGLRRQPRRRDRHADHHLDNTAGTAITSVQARAQTDALAITPNGCTV